MTIKIDDGEVGGFFDLGFLKTKKRRPTTTRLSIIQSNKEIKLFKPQLVVCSEPNHFILKFKGLCYLIDVEAKTAKEQPIETTGLSSLILKAGTHHIFRTNKYFGIEPLKEEKLGTVKNNDLNFSDNAERQNAEMKEQM